MKYRNIGFCMCWSLVSYSV